MRSLTLLSLLLFLGGLLPAMAQAQQPNVLLVKGADLTIDNANCQDTDLGIDAWCAGGGHHALGEFGLAFDCSGTVGYEVRNDPDSRDNLSVMECDDGEISQVSFNGDITCSGSDNITRTQQCIDRP